MSYVWAVQLVLSVILIRIHTKIIIIFYTEFIIHYITRVQLQNSLTLLLIVYKIMR